MLDNQTERQPRFQVALELPERGAVLEPGTTIMQSSRSDANFAQRERAVGRALQGNIGRTDTATTSLGSVASIAARMADPTLDTRLDNSWRFNKLLI